MRRVRSGAAARRFLGLAGAVAMTGLVGCGDSSRSGVSSPAQSNARFSCQVELSSDLPGRYTAIALRVFADPSLGRFEGRCEPLVAEAALFAGASCSDPSDCEAGRKPVLTVNLAQAGGYTVTDRLVRCPFAASREVSPADFAITVVEATESPSFSPIVPPPNVSVSEVACAPLSSTSTSTSTTMPSCEGVVCDAGEACFGGACDTTGRFNVTFRMEDTLWVDALSFDVDYRGAPGSFVGELADARCVRNPGINALFAKRNDSSAHTLTVAFAAGGNSFHGPLDLISCQFQSLGTAPASVDFSVEVTDARDRQFEQILPRPRIVATDIAEILP